jgi:hypothetical protein
MISQPNFARRASNRIFSLLLLSTLAMPVASKSQTTGDWNANAAGNWSDTTRWLGGTVPNGVGHIADVVHGISSSRTITLDVDVTLGTLRMGDDNASTTFILAGSETLTFDNGGAGAILDHADGNPLGGPNKSPNSGDRIDAAVILNDNLTIQADRNIELRGLWNATNRHGDDRGRRTSI